MGKDNKGTILRNSGDIDRRAVRSRSAVETSNCGNGRGGDSNINTGSKVDNARNRLRAIPASQDNHAAGDQDDKNTKMTKMTDDKRRQVATLIQ